MRARISAPSRRRSSACTRASRSWPSGARSWRGRPRGGEQQRRAIGRSLMAEPVLMLLDEPSLGLAPMLVEEIFAIIRTIHAGGTTVLLVEQNANKALSTADYGYVLETGTIALAGDSQQLLRDDRVRRSYLGHR